jgi:hypothetical protein
MRLRWACQWAMSITSRTTSTSAVFGPPNVITVASAGSCWRCQPIVGEAAIDRLLRLLKVTVRAEHSIRYQRPVPASLTVGDVVLLAQSPDSQPSFGQRTQPDLGGWRGFYS